jgi:hypothetical protein
LKLRSSIFTALVALFLIAGIFLFEDSFRHGQPTGIGSKVRGVTFYDRWRALNEPLLISNLKICEVRNRRGKLIFQFPYGDCQISESGYSVFWNKDEVIIFDSGAQKIYS